MVVDGSDVVVVVDGSDVVVVVDGSDVVVVVGGSDVVVVVDGSVGVEVSVPGILHVVPPRKLLMKSRFSVILE